MNKTCCVFAFIIVLLSFFSCKEKDGVYFLKHKNKSFQIVSARVLRDGTIENTTLQNIKLYLYTKDISFDVEKERGQGASLMLELCLDSSDIKAGQYDVLEEKLNFSITRGKRSEEGKLSGSYFRQINSSKIKKDTITELIKSGLLEISAADNNHQNDYFVRLLTESGDSLSGYFKGTHSYINNTDGAKVGEIQIGDSTFLLQRGEMMLWGDVFNKDVNYYELFFYSTNMRYSEVGKFQKGLVLVIGLNSIGADEPLDGIYQLSNGIADNTAWTGRKQDNIDWGCYWYNYVTGTIIEKSFINKNSITFKKNGNKYDVTFECLDQLGNTISGYYSSDFKRIDLR